jgi:hypothetical protein
LIRSEVLIHITRMKKLLLLLFCFISIISFAQTNQPLDINGYKTFYTSGMSASAEQAKRFEIARIFTDPTNWSTTAPVEIELHEIIYASGASRKYNVYFGYLNAQGVLTQTEVNDLSATGAARGVDNFQLTLGTPVTDGANKYLPVYVDAKYYATVRALIKTARPTTPNNTGGVTGTIYINTAPVGTNIPVFTPNNNSEFSTAGGNSIFKGNVGIGTASPITKLDVRGSIISGNPDLQLGTVGSFLQIQQAAGSGNSSSLIGAYQNGGNAFSNLILQSGGGNVGIGTTNPTQKLEVGGGRPITFNSASGRIKMKADGGGWAMDYGFTGSSGADLGGFWGWGSADAIEQWSIGKAYTDNLFVVKNTGSVGMGTGTPFSRLHVHTPGTTSSLVTTGNNNGGTIFGHDADNTGVISGYLATGIKFGINYSTTFSELMRISSNGNVGIGTTTPQGKLELGDTRDGSKFKIGDNDGNVHHLSWNRAAVFNVPDQGNGNPMYYFRKTEYGNITNQVNLFEIYNTGTIKSMGDMIANGNVRINGLASTSAPTSRPLAVDKDGNVVIGTGSSTTPDNLKTTTNVYFGRSYNSDTTNKWIIHAPQDRRREIFFAPADAAQTGWDWNKSMSLLNNGNMIVRGVGTFYANSDNIGLQIVNNANNKSMAQFVNSDPYKTWFVGNEGGAFNFWQAGYKMSILNNGNIGIGTTAPSTKLEVNGETIITGGVAGQGAKIYRDGASGGGVYGSVVGNTIIQNLTGSTIFQVGANADERMRISSNGNVGIGTTNPVYKFQVAGSTASDVIGEIRNNATNGYGLRFFNGTNANYALAVANADGTGNTIQMFGNGDALFNGKVTTSSVNIGATTMPIGYKLAVGGDVIAERVVVKLQTNWPDYVFKTGYSLRPLSEVEAFVKTNSHLPDVPSEAEIKEKGIDVEQMNATLLKKVEELTLYLIEMKKENAEIKARLQKVEAHK